MSQVPSPVTVIDQLPEALQQRKALARRFKDIEYRHYRDDWRHIPRGTAVFGETVVYGYPHIGRVLALEAGLKAHFQAPFWAEEKINGFNVRIVRIGEQVLALSRGGFVCPFTTDRLPDLMPLEVFTRHPDLVVCAEVAGPDNPYLESSPPFIEEDVELFVFDLMRKNQAGFLPYRDKQRLIETFNLPPVPLHGYFHPHEVGRIRKLMLRLHEEWREGLVFKEDSPRDHRAKYVTGNINIDDLRAAADNLLDLPAEYVTNRLLRLSLFVEEHGLPVDAELERALGAALLEGLHQAVAKFRREHRVYTTFRCRFRERENAELMLEHLKRASHQVQIRRRDLRREGDHWLLEFDRIYPSLTGMLGDLLAGRLVFD
ncbi:putative ATP-dependent DNA ligase [Methylomarinovum tepidoasis]|uniref:ATP-dependent DNA ligase n=1 Tax=Methylomarinovum tepidoasis TaxID=2840183 RepID=A0AAU9CYA4_9GAMM|nr:RNA ligase [Methylomarinovum sp. IN45]BCX89695.1 putative ATP-dependent DNA ligase [Methylomarinovum sp. IN45]